MDSGEFGRPGHFESNPNLTWPRNAASCGDSKTLQSNCKRQSAHHEYRALKFCWSALCNCLTRWWSKSHILITISSFYIVQNNTKLALLENLENGKAFLNCINGQPVLTALNCTIPFLFCNDNHVKSHQI